MLADNYGALLLLAQDRESQEAVLPTMKMPCLLFAGEEDEYQPIKECARQIANAAFFTLPGLDHSGAIRQSDKVLPHVRKFLTKVEERSKAA